VAALASHVRAELQNLPSQVVPTALQLGLPQAAAAKLHAQVDELVKRALRTLSGQSSHEEHE